ncbi:dioxygenase [Actinomadura fibrosa]|uniref:dioxygenase n=1 Tax=Actinomadura fibrosa TaxID=111802 RepID=UPI001A955214|nr:dioxygenase [Actinomadura fibrosa]
MGATPDAGSSDSRRPTAMDNRSPEAGSADVVAARMGPETDPRLRRILGSLVTHLHALKDIQPMKTERETDIGFLTATGQKCDDLRQGFILRSDVLGVPMLVETINHRAVREATEPTIGPGKAVALDSVPTAGLRTPERSEGQHGSDRRRWRYRRSGDRCFLQRAGIRAHADEQVSALRPLGAGIVLGPTPSGSCTSSASWTPLSDAR